MPSDRSNGLLVVLAFAAAVGSVSCAVRDDDIKTLSETLFRLFSAAAAPGVSVQWQKQVRPCGRDESERPLLLVLDAFRNGTFARLLDLFDNYDADVGVREDRTRRERNEERAFMSAVMQTEIMQSAYRFLQQKGIFSGTIGQFETFVDDLWFGMYDRDGTPKKVLGSSGFEHVFVGEVKNGKVSGLHNWVRYHQLEQAGKLNYHGYVSKTSLGKALYINLPFRWNGIKKCQGGMLVGTSPELEVALYTVCFMARGKDGLPCNVTLGSVPIKIVTHPFTYKGKEYIGSAFPLGTTSRNRSRGG